MPAYKTGLSKSACQTCGCRSTHEVFNTFNATCGYFCSHHADLKIILLNEYQREVNARSDSQHSIHSPSESEKMPDSTEITHRCFMDGIDWQHHLEADTSGTLLFPSVDELKAVQTCAAGGCGVVEVEVRLVRWVEDQNLKWQREHKSVSAPDLEGIKK